MPGLRVAIHTDLDVGAAGFMVDGIPTIPSPSTVGRALRRPVFVRPDEIPFPGPFFLGEVLPRLVP